MKTSGEDTGMFTCKNDAFKFSKTVKSTNSMSITCTICSSRARRNEPRTRFAYAKTKTQISFAVTAKLISAFVFATCKVQFFYFLNAKF